jgi:predicted ATPase/DNA-binding SARP family transcriptional activator
VFSPPSDTREYGGAVISASLRIELLGRFAITAGNAVSVPEETWRLRRARQLVKVLALSDGHRLHRERLIDVLWPGREPGTTTNNLRQVVFAARRAVDASGDDGSQRIGFANDIVSLCDDGLEVDVDAFEGAAEAAERDPEIERFRRAVGLYGGELLPEDRFEAWAVDRREALRSRYVLLLVGLAEALERQGDTASAVAALQQSLRADRLHERSHRELMRILAASGARQQALAQYHFLRELLRREFADEPSADTRRLYQDILTRRFEPSLTPKRAPEAAARPIPRFAARRVAVAPAAAGNLPLELTSFVGREHVLEEIAGLIERRRLVTLIGPGGCGKTRLALEVAKGLSRVAPDGIWLTELEGVADERLVAGAVAAALGAESRSARPPEEAIIAHVGQARMLLVLDNCEHVIEACAGLVERLLSRLPELRVLATSRQPLHASGEVNWRVPSLSLEEAELLFSERAASISSRFALSDANAQAVRDICRQVEGIPLAIELAAARVGVLSPAQIAERLQGSLDVLARGPRPVLTRQQTLVATLDWSYELLEDDERRLFGQMSVFAGSCGLEAMEEICAGDLDTLGALVDKSLVVAEEQGDEARYRLLEPVRHYARGRLPEDERRALELRHRNYYLRLAQSIMDANEPAAANARLQLELAELRRVLADVVVQEPDSAIALAGALWRFWHDRGSLAEGAGWLEAALRSAPRPDMARARALHGLSVLTIRLSKRERTFEAANEAVSISRASDDAAALSEALHHLGTMHWIFADFAAAERRCNEALELARASAPAVAASVTHTLGVIAASRNQTSEGRLLISDGLEQLQRLPPADERVLFPVSLGYGPVPGHPLTRCFLEQTFVTARRLRPGSAVPYALCNLAAAARNDGRLTEARAVLEQSLALFRRNGDELGVADALHLLGGLHSREGDHDTARELLEEALTIRGTARDARGVGLSRLALSVAAAWAGHADDARGQCEIALDGFERSDDAPGRGSAMMQLGYLAADRGEIEEAHRLQEEALERWRGYIPDIFWCALGLLELARLDVILGRPDAARARVNMAAGICRRNGDTVTVTLCERLLAELPNEKQTAA